MNTVSKTFKYMYNSIKEAPNFCEEVVKEQLTSQEPADVMMGYAVIFTMIVLALVVSIMVLVVPVVFVVGFIAWFIVAYTIVRNKENGGDKRVD